MPLALLAQRPPQSAAGWVVIDKTRSEAEQQQHRGRFIAQLVGGAAIDGEQGARPRLELPTGMMVAINEPALRHIQELVKGVRPHRHVEIRGMNAFRKNDAVDGQRHRDRAGDFSHGHRQRTASLRPAQIRRKRRDRVASLAAA